MHQGPYSEKPSGNTPDIPGWEWFENGGHTYHERGWKQVRDGSWYAFYANVGPNTGWGVEHDDDPNWWWRPSTGTAPPGPLVCRHGCLPKKEALAQGTPLCPDGSCGDEPRPVPTDEEVLAAGLAALKILRSMEGAE